MTASSSIEVTAFAGNRRVASGSPAEVTRAIKEQIAKGETAPVLVFDNQTGSQIDLNLGQWPSGSQASTAFSSESPNELKTAGRPKLGVVAREVTLLPRHWEWLGQQQGGASAALRKLVDQARRENSREEKIRTAREAIYRFMTAMAGNAPGYEEALRALFAGDSDRFSGLIADWPTDVREHIQHMAADAGCP
jgi:uncharacterized protein